MLEIPPDPHWRFSTSTRCSVKGSFFQYYSRCSRLPPEVESPLLLTCMLGEREPCEVGIKHMGMWCANLLFRSAIHG